jgi:hypothetical protein
MISEVVVSRAGLRRSTVDSRGTAAERHAESGPSKSLDAVRWSEEIEQALGDDRVVEGALSLKSTLDRVVLAPNALQRLRHLIIRITERARDLDSLGQRMCVVLTMTRRMVYLAARTTAVERIRGVII